MGTVEFALIILLGLTGAWLLFRGFSNSRHASPKNLRGGERRNARASGIGYGPPRS